jgi:hypothetical protein
MDENVAEGFLANWDARLASQISPEEVDRLTVNLEGGICGNTTYSGMDTPVDALTQSCNAFAASRGIKRPRVEMVSSSDIGDLQQSVLVQRSKRRRLSHCVFGDMALSLHEAAQTMVDAMMPELSATVLEAANAYRSIEAYLLSQWDWAAPSSKTSFCYAHSCLCPIHPGWICNQHRLQREEVVPAPDLHCEQEVVERSSNSAWWSQPPSLVSSDDDDSLETRRPLLLHVSGLTCTDYSSLGAQKQEAGPSNRAHAVWMVNRKARCLLDEEDIYITECATRYKPQSRQGVLSATHHIVSILSGPELLGYPHYRLRSFAAGISKANYVWVGPKSDQAIQADYTSKFRQDVQCSAAAYLIASEDEILSHSRKLASDRKTPLGSEVTAAMVNENLHRICPAGMLVRKSSFEKFFVQNNVPPPWFGDLDHNVSYGTAGEASFLPVLDTHPRLFTWPNGLQGKGQRFMTPKELLFAQGFNVSNSLHRNRSESDLVGIFDTLRSRDQCFLLGNGMHVPTVASWMIYVLSNIVRIDLINTIARPLSASTTRGDELWEEPPLSSP